LSSGLSVVASPQLPSPRQAVFSPMYGRPTIVDKR